MQKRPKICTCCRVTEAKFYLYHSTKIAKAGPGFDDWPEHPSVQINASTPCFTKIWPTLWSWSKGPLSLFFRLKNFLACTDQNKLFNLKRWRFLHRKMHIFFLNMYFPPDIKDSWNTSQWAFLYEFNLDMTPLLIVSITF